MGYTTTFDGRIDIDRELDDYTYNLLIGLQGTRRMRRDPAILARLLGKTTEEVINEYGRECELYFFEDGKSGQSHTDDIIDYNSPPTPQPSLWLNWVPTSDKRGIIWNGAEKFYEADLWMKYIIDRILAPKGYVLNGVIDAQGEEYDDLWKLVVRDNKVLTLI